MHICTKVGNLLMQVVKLVYLLLVNIVVNKPVATAIVVSKAGKHMVVVNLSLYTSGQ